MYSVFDKLGGWKNAVVDGNTLYAEPALREKPETEQVKMMREMLEDDTPITFSIGFRPMEMEEMTDGKGGRDGYRYKSGDLMEISPVGIPSNPDAVSSFIVTRSAALLKYMETLKMTTKADDPKPEDKPEDEQKPEDEEPKYLTVADIPAIVVQVMAALKEAEEDKPEDEEKPPKEDEEKSQSQTPPGVAKGIGPEDATSDTPTTTRGIIWG